MFCNGLKEHFKRFGMDCAFWVTTDGSAPDHAGMDTGKQFQSIFDDYDKMDVNTVTRYCTELSACPYEAENMEDSSEVIRKSIGPNLLKKACKNGNYNLLAY